MEDSDDEPPAAPPPKKMATANLSPPPSKSGNGGGASKSKPSSSGGGGGAGGGAVAEVSERLELYRKAVQQAQESGESSKVRRYKRSLTTIEQVRGCHLRGCHVIYMYKYIVVCV